MIGKHKFVVVTDRDPIVVWEKDITTARAEFAKKEPEIPIVDILPNKEYLKKYKKVSKKVASAPSIVTVEDATL